jgi:hypothetical protein
MPLIEAQKTSYRTLDLAWPLKSKRGIDGIVVTSAQEAKWSLTRYHVGSGDNGSTREWSTFYPCRRINLGYK